MELEGADNFTLEQDIEGWVMDKCDNWRDHYEANYSEKFEEYYRLWRGHWSAQDQTRQSERSKIISPALQQAVESSVAELEKLPLVVVSGLTLKMMSEIRTLPTLQPCVVTWKKTLQRTKSVRT